MTITDYSTLFPASSRAHPRFMAFARAVFRQADDLFPLVDSLVSGFSFPYAEGIQLDILAAAVGLRRESDMEDEPFRQYLLAKLALWTWDGTNEGVPAVLAAGLPGSTENDNQDGTVTVEPAGIPREWLPVPAGVRIQA